MLTAIAISAGNEHDGHHPPHWSSSNPPQRRPQRVIGDTAYGNIEVREQLEQRAISVLAPLHTTGSNNDDTIHKDQFAINLDAETVTCPARQRDADLQVPTQPAGGQRSRVARFTRTDSNLVRCGHAARRAARIHSAAKICVEAAA